MSQLSFNALVTQFTYQSPWNKRYVLRCSLNASTEAVLTCSFHRVGADFAEAAVPMLR